MSKTMLIDAAHAEETRVAIVDGRQVEEFDFESRARRQLRGNIYLAKVTRVEPSLQAAFVEYGGNRHGFLAFNEIHPDYYQIPVADREAIMAEAHDDADDDDLGRESSGDDVDSDGKLADEERLKRRLMRRYKIQDVIKRRQILLVQVVKDERGAKGAALTTWLSLAGRYCVLMPNTGKGGGISRKITNTSDRRRLKAAASALKVPQGMGLIIRTAGAKRTRAEIKRDYEYLLRLWETIRELTLRSNAPAMIHEEENLVRRAVRDMYDKDFDGIQVEGVEGFKQARDFMRVLMPSQAKKIHLYQGSRPLFASNGIEEVLTQIHQPVVPLKSGGYLVINQTEALVAIDVNSGRATKERNVEATATKTNMEAAVEAARQLRLRDLAGLIVVDFIDMEEKRNNRAVEKKMKDCLKDDRARIQVGRISHFGLLEMSRQRIRASVLESTMQVCQHCGGTGHVRSDSSMALHIIRGIEDYLLRHSGFDINVRTPAASALYVLNHKRQLLADLEGRFGVAISIDADESVGHQHFVIDKGAASTRPITQPPVQPMAYIEDDIEDPEIPVDEDEAEEEATADVQAREDRGDEGDRKRRRRRRRRGGRDRENPEQAAKTDSVSEDASDEDDDADDAQESSSNASLSEEDRRKKRRRGRRGGRKNRRDDEPRARKVPDPEFVGYTPVLPVKAEEAVVEAVASVAVEQAAEVAVPAIEATAEDKPAKTARKPRARKSAKTEEAAEDVVAAVAEEKPAKPARKTRSRKKVAEEAPAEPVAVADEAEAEKPKRRTRRAAAKPAVEVEETVAVEAEVATIAEPQKSAEPVVTSSESEDQKPKRAGWWQKKGFF